MQDAGLSQEVNTVARRVSTRAVFFIAGFAMGVWAPLVPYAQQRLQLDAGSLGLLLLCLGTGSLITMLFSGKLTSRFGCRAMVIAGALMACLALPLLATTESLSLMIASLLLFGAGVGLTDVTVNIQGTLVEQQSEVPLMSGFHGLFSVGGIAGAAGGSLVLGAGMSPLLMVFSAVTLMLLTMILSLPHLLPFASHQQQQHSVFRLNLRLILMAGMCMLCFLAEGAMLDWSGIWLTEQRGLAIEHAGWGYAVFGGAMALMRLTGDRLVSRLGRKKLLILSGVFAAAGYALAVLLPGIASSLGGFILVGIGAANVAPVITTLAGKEQVMPSNLSVAFVATVGYLGILMGPAVLGFIAHGYGLAMAFTCMSLSLLLVAAGALKLDYR